MIKRFRNPVRVVIGQARISGRLPDSANAATRDIRKQMSKIMRNYEAWVNHMDRQSADVIVQALQPAFAKSQVYVPVDTGALKASGYLESRRFRGRTIAEIGYSRSGHPDYGPVVHENLDFFHKPPTQAKFLQRALEEHNGQIQSSLASGYREASGV